MVLNYPWVESRRESHKNFCISSIQHEGVCRSLAKSLIFCSMGATFSMLIKMVICMVGSPIDSRLSSGALSGFIIQ